MDNNAFIKALLEKVTHSMWCKIVAQRTSVFYLLFIITNTSHQANLEQYLSDYIAIICADEKIHLH